MDENHQDRAEKRQTWWQIFLREAGLIDKNSSIIVIPEAHLIWTDYKCSSALFWTARESNLRQPAHRIVQIDKPCLP
jgi:hypothetical protein